MYYSLNQPTDRSIDQSLNQLIHHQQLFLLGSKKAGLLSEINLDIFGSLYRSYYLQNCLPNSDNVDFSLLYYLHANY